MSTRETIINLINGFSEKQLNGLLTMLTGYSQIVAEEQDDAYCTKLYLEAQDEQDGETKSVEDFAKELGINIA